jgi:hypothetical protein
LNRERRGGRLAIDKGASFALLAAVFGFLILQRLRGLQMRTQTTALSESGFGSKPEAKAA